MLEMLLYADTTGFYTDEEINANHGDNMAYGKFPREIVERYFKTLDYPEDVTFEKWLQEIYTCDDTDDLIPFAKEHGYILKKEDTYLYNLSGNWEYVEFCNECETENEKMNYDPDVSGWVITCKGCGRQMFLCDACRYRDDFKDCDWHETPDGSECFRGKITQREIKNDFVWDLTEEKFNSMIAFIGDPDHDEEFFGCLRIGDICFDIQGYDNVNELSLFVGGVDSGYGYGKDGYPYDHIDYYRNTIEEGMSFEKYKERTEALAKKLIRENGLIDKANQPLHVW